MHRMTRASTMHTTHLVMSSQLFTTPRLMGYRKSLLSPIISASSPNNSRDLSGPVGQVEITDRSSTLVWSSPENPARTVPLPLSMITWQSRECLSTDTWPDSDLGTVWVDIVLVKTKENFSIKDIATDQIFIYNSKFTPYFKWQKVWQ